MLLVIPDIAECFVLLVGELLVCNFFPFWVTCFVYLVPGFEITVDEFLVVASLGSSSYTPEFVCCEFPFVMTTLLVELLAAFDNGLDFCCHPLLVAFEFGNLQWLAEVLRFVDRLIKRVHRCLIVALVCVVSCLDPC